MTRSARTGVLLGGAVFAVLGLIALAVPIFTTKQASDVAKVGPVQVSVTTETPHTVPPMAGAAALAVGLVLIGTGLVVRT